MTREEEPVLFAPDTTQAKIPGQVPPEDPVEAPLEGSAFIRLYFASQRFMQVSTLVLSSAFTGFWLGVLNRKQLHAINQHYFSKERFYSTDEYNKQGLFNWEKRAVENHFSECKKLLLVAAGGGREVIALRGLGFDVEGFDAHPGLVRFANGLLEREGMVPDIGLVRWDHGPAVESKYDGVIVGWGAYMHIRGRDRRIAFLRELRELVVPGSPILLSFYVTSEKSRYFRLVTRVGRVVAGILRREPVNLGDCLNPFYAHFFTQGRLEPEMVRGGFEMVSYELVEYGHAIGRAV